MRDNCSTSFFPLVFEGAWWFKFRSRQGDYWSSNSSVCGDSFEWVDNPWQLPVRTAFNAVMSYLSFHTMLGMFSFYVQSNSPKDIYYQPSFTVKESELGHKLSKSNFMVSVLFYITLKIIVAKYVTECRNGNHWGPVLNIPGFWLRAFSWIIVFSLFFFFSGHLFNDILSGGDIHMYPTMFLSRYARHFINASLLKAIWALRNGVIWKEMFKS